MERKHSFLNRIAFADDTNDKGLPWIDVFKKGEFHDPRYGVVPVDDDLISSIVKNFNDNVRGIDIAIDFEHGKDASKGNKAAGWIRGLRTVDDKVQAAVEFTQEAQTEIKDKQWRYFSPEWVDDYTHSDSGEKFTNVLLGGALTNRPVIKGMAPINFAEAVLDEELTLVPEDVVAPPAPPVKVIEEPKEEIVDEVALRKELGLPEDADGAAITAAILALKTDAKSFAELRDLADKSKSFAEQFPTEFAERQELRSKVMKSEAKEFAESFKKPVEIDGKRSKVLAPRATEKIEEVYVEFADGKGTLKAFSEVLNVIRDAGLVTLGESGSSIDAGGEDMDDKTKVTSFAEEMGKVMRSEKLDPHEAMMKVAQDKPELYQAYLNRNIPAGMPTE